MTQTKLNQKPNHFEDKQYWLYVPDQSFIRVQLAADDKQDIAQGKTDDASTKSNVESNVVRVRHVSTGREYSVNRNELEDVNPVDLEMSEDLANLTILNEPSVLHCIQKRYENKQIYTYSGIFLLAINPYRSMPIYTNEKMQYYRNYYSSIKPRPEPHIFAICEKAMRDMQVSRANQSILVTGESGAGKTESTKFIMQYMTSVSSSNRETFQRNKLNSDDKDDTKVQNLEAKIVKANVILEAFGNAKTAKNNNSSRFGKFIRLNFTSSSSICGASIEWYLLEKSRTTLQASGERNFHIFYQMLRGLSKKQLSDLHLDKDISLYNYLGSKEINVPEINDLDMYKETNLAFDVFQFGTDMINSIYRMLAAVLLIGNISIGKSTVEQARILNMEIFEKVCYLLGVSQSEFSRALLNPSVKAGYEWITSSRTATQVLSTLQSLARSIYEKVFGFIVNQINKSLQNEDMPDSFIGILDIAGFEIFDSNNFEQFCINYTNEKLQQYFNHNMFVAEQARYAEENIDWDYIDFGNDLQPTIDLIEKSNPVGILSCLDEECVVPKATDKTFTEKLYRIWEKQSDSFINSKNRPQCFIIKHYAANVEYVTDNWLQKNTDPVSSQVEKLLCSSRNSFCASLFANGEEGADQYDMAPESSRGRHHNSMKKGIFRTVAQRHKEQLNFLLNQLGTTNPHFVRCMLPNRHKKAGEFEKNLILDQLRCNGVLEGIRIAQAGYPNRICFDDFAKQFQILMPASKKAEYKTPKAFCEFVLSHYKIDPSLYKIGLTKIFFRVGTLATLADEKQKLSSDYVRKIQSMARGANCRKRLKRTHKQDEAGREIISNLRLYSKVQDNLWFRLHEAMRPLVATYDFSEASRTREAELNDLRSSIDKKDKQLTDYKEKYLESVSRIDALTKMIEVERGIYKSKEDLYERCRVRLAKLDEELDLAYTDIEDLEKQCETLFKTKHKLENQIEELTAQISEGAKIISAYDKILPQVKKEKEILRESNKLENNTQYIQMKDENVRLQEEGDKLRKHLADWEIHISKLKQELAKKVELLMNTEKKASTLDGQVELLKSEKTKLQKEKITLEDELKTLSLENKKLLKDMKMQTMASETMQSAQTVLNEKVNKLESESQKLRDENKIYGLKVKSMHDLNEQLQSENETLKEKEKLGNELKLKVYALESCIRMHETDIKELKSKNAAVKNEKTKLASECGNLKKTLESLRQEKEKSQKDLNKKDLQIQSLQNTIKKIHKRASNAEDAFGQVDFAKENSESSNLNQEIDDIFSALAKKDNTEKALDVLHGQYKTLRENLERLLRGES